MNLSSLKNLLNAHLRPDDFTTEIQGELINFSESIENGSPNLPILINGDIVWNVNKQEVLVLLHLILENKINENTFEYIINCLEKAETASYSDELGDTLPLVLITGIHDRDKIKRILTLLKEL